MKKSLQFFMTETDEANMSDLIRQIAPAVQFIDDQIWLSNQPPVKNSIQECSSGFVYIWNPEIISVLPYVDMADGRVRGPASGVVIQFIRSRRTSTDIFNDVLLSGSIGTGFDPSTVEGGKMKEFTHSVWEILKQISKSKAVPVSPFSCEPIGKPDPKIRIGKSASVWALSGNGLKYRSAENYYLPEK